MRVLIAAMLLGFATNASAVLISTVGDYDVVIAQTNLPNSGDATEKGWIESVLNTSVTYAKVNGSGGDWVSVTDGVAGDYAFDFGADASPGYFLVNVGGGGGTGTDNTHFLFENLGSMRWAFVNLSVFGEGVSLTNIGVISHVGVTGNVTVPTPGPLVLLGAGLLALGFTRRFTRRRISG